MDDLIYLDNASTSFPKPEETYVFMDRFYRRYGVNPGRATFDLCVEAGRMLETTRRQLTALFNGTDWTRLVFGHNSTDALNLALYGLLGPGDHAITTTIEHNSVLRPLYQIQQRDGVLVDYVPVDAKGFVDPDEIRRRFRKNTKVVAVNHASNVIGTVQPLQPIGGYCREYGAALVVDASQSAGKVPIDVQAMNIGVLCFTGHKSLLGPTGVGGAYVADHVTIRHTRGGGTGVRSAQRTHLNEYPYRLEYGTPNLAGIAGLHAGVSWVEQRGVDAIHEHEMRLTTRLRDGLGAIEGVTLYCQDDLSNHIGVLLCNVTGVEAGQTGTLLDVEHKIAVRTALHCAPLIHEQLGTSVIQGGVRFGIGPFNTEQDIDQAIAAIGEIAARASRLT